jgi:general stress protein YciG
MARSGSTETSRRGFAAMDPAKQREIASKGGKAAHQKGTAHEFTPDEARVAGKKGGDAVSRDREHMARIGREGGQARAANRARQDRDRVTAMPMPDEQRPPQLQAEEEE